MSVCSEAGLCLILALGPGYQYRGMQCACLDSQQILLPTPNPRLQLLPWNMEGIRGLGQLTPTASPSAELGSYPSSQVAWLCLQGPQREEAGQR